MRTDTSPSLSNPAWHAALRSRIGETPGQAGLLFSAHTVSILLGLLSGMILLWSLETADLGKYIFCVTVIAISNLCFEFGFFSAGARLLATAPEPAEERRIMGALVLLGLGVSVAFAVFVAIAAMPLARFFAIDVGFLLVSVSPLAAAAPLQLLAEQSCQGLNRIRRLSAMQLLNSGGNIALLALFLAMGNLNTSTALVAHLFGTGLAAVLTIAGLKPAFTRPGEHLKGVVRGAREFGLNIYVARLTGTASTRMDTLIITYLAGEVALALYGVAQKVGNPITTMARSIAVTRFRAFARSTSVSGRLILWNVIIIGAASLALAIVGPPALGFVFPKHAGAASLLIPFAVLNFFAGLFQPYNLFLASHGRGAALRNIAIAVTASSIVGLLIAVPRFGVMGAAWVGASVMALDYGLHLYYYREFRRHTRNEPDPTE